MKKSTLLQATEWDITGRVGTSREHVLKQGKKFEYRGTTGSLSLFEVVRESVKGCSCPHGATRYSHATVGKFFDYALYPMESKRKVLYITIYYRVDVWYSSPSLSRESSGRKQMKLREFVSRWPVLEQLRTRADGTGPEAMSNRSRDLKPKNHGAQVSRSICPYCGVGCGQLVYHKGDRLISIEGDPQSPISRGRLCPKGSDTHELHTHTGRLKKVKYRRPFSRRWEEIDLETAMDMVADRVWETREKDFQETKDGQPLMQVKRMAHLGGATLDIEENYVIRKLFTAGLGMVCVSNQARI